MQISFVLATITSVVAAADPSFNDAAYLAKSSVEKVSQIWNSGIQNTKPQGWFNAIEMAGLLTESMTPTMT
jgi:hypothetical protein